MRADTYTKFILTIIALCLMWICVRDVISIPPTQAASSSAPAQEVVITGVKIPLRDGSGAQVTDINGKPMFTWELPVRQMGR